MHSEIFAFEFKLETLQVIQIQTLFEYLQSMFNYFKVSKVNMLTFYKLTGKPLLIFLILRTIWINKYCRICSISKVSRKPLKTKGLFTKCSCLLRPAGSCSVSSQLSSSIWQEDAHRRWSSSRGIRTPRCPSLSPIFSLGLSLPHVHAPSNRPRSPWPPPSAPFRAPPCCPDMLRRSPSSPAASPSKELDRGA
jgi:hypothetical protein